MIQYIYARKMQKNYDMKVEAITSSYKYLHELSPSKILWQWHISLQQNAFDIESTITAWIYS